MQFKSGTIAILGRPNAGKSSLLNCLLQTELSIVTAKPQTTRERINGVLSQDHGQIIFIDTPGVHQAKAGGLNEFMVDEARSSLAAPDLIWYLVDPDSKAAIEAPLIEMISASSAPVFLVLTKKDKKLANEVNALELSQAVFHGLKEKGKEPLQSFWISSLKKAGTEELLTASCNLLPEGEPQVADLEALSDKPVRFFVSEKIREQLFLQMGQEVPYSCAVKIRSYKETPERDLIHATIVVERESQKGMVIGKGGQKIKAIGIAARQSIEKLVGKSVYLELKVDVEKEWTRDLKRMKGLGYQPVEKGVHS